MEGLSLLLTVLVAVVGWLFNAHKERQYRRFELRTTYRVKMLEDALAATWKLAREKGSPESRECLEQARSQVAIFGTLKEREVIERLCRAVESGDDFPETANIDTLVTGIRKELGLPERETIEIG